MTNNLCCVLNTWYKCSRCDWVTCTACIPEDHSVLGFHNTVSNCLLSKLGESQAMFEVRGRMDPKQPGIYIMEWDPIKL